MQCIINKLSYQKTKILYLDNNLDKLDNNYYLRNMNYYRMLNIDWIQFHNKLDNYYNSSRKFYEYRHRNNKDYKDIDKLKLDNDDLEHYKLCKLLINLHKLSKYNSIYSKLKTSLWELLLYNFSNNCIDMNNMDLLLS